MLYNDGVLTIYQLTDDSSPDKCRLKKISEHWYGEKIVGVTRLYAARQANCKVDMLLEIWEDRAIMPGWYCIPEDGEQYRITDIRHSVSKDELRVSNLTLERVNQNYELEETTICG